MTKDTMVLKCGFCNEKITKGETACYTSEDEGVLYCRPECLWAANEDNYSRVTVDQKLIEKYGNTVAVPQAHCFFCGKQFNKDEAIANRYCSSECMKADYGR